MKAGVLTASDKQQLDQLFAELATMKAFVLAVHRDPAATQVDRWQAWEQLLLAKERIGYWLAKFDGAPR